MAGDRCSFCGLRRSEVAALVVGIAGVAICRQCAEIASRFDEVPEPPTERVYSNLSTVVTQDARTSPDFGVISNASIVVRSDHIAWLGRSVDLPVRYREFDMVDCDNRMAIPGLIDAGSALLGTLPASRPDPDWLIASTALQLGNALGHGVTSIDIRVGGSGDPTIDTVLLAASRAAADVAGDMQVSITWVASERFAIDQLEGVMGPTVGRIASSVEMACDGSQHAEDLRRRLETLQRVPVRVRLCVEWPEACAALADGARSVESARWHVLPNGSVPVLEPLGALDGDPLNARALWDAGGRPAIASRSNPDGRQVNGLTLALCLLVSLGGLEPQEALWCATRGGAKALGDPSRGRLRMGDPADLVILDTDALSDVVDRPDANPVWRVVAAGLEPLE